MSSSHSDRPVSSADGRKDRSCDDPGGTHHGNESASGRKDSKAPTVWKVIHSRLGVLIERLDMRLLCTSMWSKGLITIGERQRYSLETKANTEHVSELLASLIQLNNPQQFYTFLSVLQETDRYKDLAMELRKEADKIAPRGLLEGPQRDEGTAASAVTPVNSQSGDDGEADASGEADISTSPWKVVKKRLKYLIPKLDVKSIRTELWTSGLIDYAEYSRYDLGDKTQPQLAEHLLTTLIQNDQPQEFYTFLSVLQKVPRYQEMAKTLAEDLDLAGGESGGPRIHPFIMARRCNGKPWDIRVDDRTIYEVSKWYRSSRSQTFQDETNISQPMFPFTGAEDDADALFESSKLLQVAVSLLQGCTGQGSRRIVILAGEIEEIVAWLQPLMPANSEGEFGKLLNPNSDYTSNEGTADDEIEGEMRGNPITGSGIYCLLPNGGDTIYIIVRLRWMDEPDVHISLLRMALQMSPLWLIFYSKTGIEENQFCAEADIEPDLRFGQCFGESFMSQEASMPLLNKLRRVFEHFPYDDTAGKGGVRMLHIQFVFNVTLKYFSQTMVYHRSGMDGCEARCMIQAKDKFAVRATVTTRNESVAQAKQGLPDLTLGISLQEHLKPLDVKGYRIDPEWWLKMICGYVPIMLWSCSIDQFPKSDFAAASVACSVFPAPHQALVENSAVQNTPSDSDENAIDGENCPEPLTKPATERVAEAMGVHMKLPAAASLSYVLNAWSGPVQVIACVGSDKAEVSEFLNSLTGSAFMHYMHGQAVCDAACSVDSAMGPFRKQKPTSTSTDGLHGRSFGSGGRLKLSSGHDQSTTEVRVEVPDGAPLTADSVKNREYRSVKKHHPPQVSEEVLQRGNIVEDSGSKKEDVNLSRALSHSCHPEQVRMWLCCRPTHGMLHVLLSCEQPLLTGANCICGSHQSAALVAAAALANVFVVLTKKFDESVDVVKDALLDGLHVHGHLMPDRTKRDVQLFNNVLVPVVPHTNVDHECNTTKGKKCCSAHFQRICKQSTWREFSNELQFYFRAVQPVYSKRPARVVRKIMMECGYSYESGMAFQTMLNLMLATMSTQGLQDEPSLEVLKLHHISEKPWIDFQQKLINALLNGKVDNVFLAGESGNKIRVDIGGGKGHGQEPIVLSSGIILGLLHGEDASKKGKLTRFPELSPEQCESIHKVMLAVARAFHTHMQQTISHKDVPPVMLKSALQQVFDALTRHRQDVCNTWLQSSITNQPFAGVETREKCEKIIGRLSRHWQFCGKRCQTGNGCRYWCLLPKGHDQTKKHDCLDPKKSHRCEHNCTLCIKESRLTRFSKEANKSLNSCLKAAGHQHDGGYEIQLHSCIERHRCKEQCSLSLARGCLVKPSEPNSGRCVKRMDHVNQDGERDLTHLCDVKEEKHLCHISCLLKRFGNCNGGLCNKQYGDMNHAPHLCGSMHECIYQCKQPGVCLVSDSANVKGGERLSDGTNGFRLTCRYTVKKDAIDHRDLGACACDQEHKCDRFCPCCKHYCTKPYGHRQLTGSEALCRVNHGKIIDTSLMQVRHGVSKEWLDIAGNGEFRCDNVCLSAGRGHCHRRPRVDNIDPNWEWHSSFGQKRFRVWHSVFWAMLGFEEPYSVQDLIDFDKCAKICPRHGEESTKVFCTGPLWHSRFSRIADDQTGFVGQKRDGKGVHGHHFPCPAENHPCRLDCTVLMRYRRATCPSKCERKIGHAEDEGCDCLSGKHICGKECVKFERCKKTCELSVESLPHKCCCKEPGCPEQCKLCSEDSRCGNDQHIHELKEGEFHHCGKLHPCSEVCEAKGICWVRKPEEKSSCEPPKDRLGKRLVGGAFRLKCVDEYPIGKDSHLKPHHCGEKHNCTAKCPHCGRYCSLEIGHNGEHDTKHGVVTNISRLVILSAKSEVIPFPSNDDVRCDQLCDDAGPSHEHAIQCPGDCSSDGHRHPDNSHHLVRHEIFWDSCAFTDPYKESGKSKLFNRCHVRCPHPTHKSSEVYCSGKRNHVDVLSAKMLPSLTAKVYVGHARDGIAGHYFECPDHKCVDLNHTCEWSSKEGCEKDCSLELGHEGDCKCESNNHRCGNRCAGTACIDGECCIHMETHSNEECSCGKLSCQKMCEICKVNQCHMKDHFHKVSPPEIHHCGREHLCDEECLEDGICALTSSELPEGMRFRKLIGTNALKLLCVQRRQPGERNHDSLHSCGRKHTCSKQCHFCNFYCEREFNHAGKCSLASHGVVNLKTAKIVQYADHKHEEFLVKVTCDQLCIKAGKGHRHVMDCTCAWTTSYGRPSAMPRGTRLHHKSKKDLVLHSEFWNSLNPSFLDPALELSLDGCPLTCPLCETGKRVVFCSGTADHKKFPLGAEKDVGYVCPKLSQYGKYFGHEFLCGGHPCGKSYGGCSLKAGGKVCKSPCALPFGHTTKCQCDSTEHICGHTCQAALKCSRTCKKDANDSHKSCSCGQDHCNATCEYNQCSNLCSRGHVHETEQEESMFVHYCDNDHPCLNWCKTKGVCEVHNENANKEGCAQLKPYMNHRNGFLRQCILRCPKGYKGHDTSQQCLCSLDKTEHMCVFHCPLCFMNCELPYHHTGQHTLSHGHVCELSKKTSVIVSSDGKTGVMSEEKRCHDLCEFAGRGHTHRKHDGQFRHTAFWQSIKCQDPCSLETSAFLDGCPELCTRDHEHGSVYCTEKLGHPPITQASRGYLWPSCIGSNKGLHHFPCDNHECEKECQKLRKGKKCNGLCSLPLGHSEDKQCTCGVPHKCGKECSAENCKKTCELTLEDEHSDHSHNCLSQSPCPASCVHCDSNCHSDKHLHDLQKNEDILHHCNRTHVCQDSKLHGGKKPLCEVQPDANCRALVAADGEDLAVGAKARDCCSRIIPVGQTAHQGLHCHSSDWLMTSASFIKHFCNERCFTCGNCCALPIQDHPPFHDTTHGKVKGHILKNLVVVQGHSNDFTKGRLEQAERQRNMTCTEVCADAGRGHLHTAVCKKSFECMFFGKHGAVVHDEVHQVDITSHRQYYTTKLVNRFADHSPEDLKKQFALCGHRCPHPDHEQLAEDGSPKVEYCSLPLLHEPVVDQSLYKWRYCADGHVFGWHRCGQRCEYSDKAPEGSCAGEGCSNKSGHDESCNCGIRRHPCREKCAVHEQSAELCAELCQFSCEEHAAQYKDHVCEARHCTHRCDESDCIGTCGRPHLHVLGENRSHLCEEHLKPRCEQKCTQPGWCSILLGSEANPDSYLDSQSNVDKGLKVLCRVKHVSANPQVHRCQREQHFCKFQCPLCGFFCKQIFGHHGKHDVDHGHVSVGHVQVFKANLVQVHLDKAVPCEEICQIAGRGHFHRWPCVTPKEYHDTTERVHCNGNLDLIPHSKFFNILALHYFYKPDFDKCGAICHELYEDNSGTPCSLACLHIIPGPVHQANLEDGVVTLRGHSFPKCSHKCSSACEECSLSRQEGKCTFLDGHSAREGTTVHTCMDHCEERCPICTGKCFLKANHFPRVHACKHLPLTEATPLHTIWKDCGRLPQSRYVLTTEDTLEQTCENLCKLAGPKHKHVIQECDAGRSKCFKRSSSPEKSSLVKHEYAVMLGYNDTAEHNKFWQMHNFVDPTTASSFSSSVD